MLVAMTDGTIFPGQVLSLLLSTYDVTKESGTVKRMEKKSLDLILEKLPERISAPLQNTRKLYEDKATEIILRSERPVCIAEGHKMRTVLTCGCLTDRLMEDHALIVTQQEIEQIFMRLCDYSVYAFQNEINSGFITIGGGVRVGLCGKAVMSENKIVNIRDIGTLSFRIARDIHGCASHLLKTVQPLGGILLCGAPGSGKTTMIRDMARQLSYRYRVSVLDERGELSAFSRGKSGFELGLCDIYAGYPKGLAANCAIRSMAPQIMVCDEMGDQKDVALLTYSMRCGVAFIATVHAGSMQDLHRRESAVKMIDTGAFRYVVFLSGEDSAGQVDKIVEMSDACV